MCPAVNPLHLTAPEQMEILKLMWTRNAFGSLPTFTAVAQIYNLRHPNKPITYRTVSTLKTKGFTKGICFCRKSQNANRRHENAELRSRVKALFEAEEKKKYSTGGS